MTVYVTDDENKRAVNEVKSRIENEMTAKEARTLEKKLEREHLERMMDSQFRGVGFTGWRTQFKFHPTRKWRFDFYFQKQRIAVEVEGGTWKEGKTGHTSGAGFRKDCEKYNEAAKMGIRVFRFTGDMIKSGEAISFLEGLGEL